MDSIDLSIIIVNYNTRDLLHNCLDSIYDTVKEINFEVVVIDNNSTDGSVNKVKETFPTVKLIENKENDGFPKANNRGIKLVNGKYILLINPDTIVLPSAINKMVACLDANSNVGAVGPMTLSGSGEISLCSARNFPTVMSVVWWITGLATIFPKNKIFGKYYMSFWDHMTTRDIECISGACMMVRKYILDKCHGFVEVMYAEDMDLCYRIRKDGWNIRYLSDSKIIHYSKQSSKTIPNSWSVAANESGLIWFIHKHQGTASGIIVKSMLLANHLFRFLVLKLLQARPLSDSETKAAKINKTMLHKEVFMQLLKNNESGLPCNK